MKTCPQCGAENEADHNYCDRCGDSLAERWQPFARPRYEALARVSNGLLFLSRLAAAAGAIAGVGVGIHFWRRSLLVALFFAGAAVLAGYVLRVLLSAGAEFLRLTADVEDHLRTMRGPKR